MGWSVGRSKLIVFANICINGKTWENCTMELWSEKKRRKKLVYFFILLSCLWIICSASHCRSYFVAFIGYAIVYNISLSWKLTVWYALHTFRFFFFAFATFFMNISHYFSSRQPYLLFADIKGERKTKSNRRKKKSLFILVFGELFEVRQCFPSGYS